jgi:hypothetical protein
MCRQSHLQFSWFIWFMLSGLAMFYIFRKKWGFVWSYVCWSVLIQSHYGGVVIVGWESDLCANDMSWFKCVFRLILSNDLLIYQWNPMFIFCRFTNMRKTIFFENKCLFKYFKSIIYCPIFLNTFSSTDGILCFFSLNLNTRKNVSFV